MEEKLKDLYSYNDINIIKDFGEVKVPKDWSEITLKKYQEIERYYEDKDKEFNVLDVLDILIDKDKDYIMSLPTEFLDTILTHLLFLVTTPDVGEPSNKIKIDGEEYIINVMEKLKLGEYVAVDNVIKADKSDYASILAILCRKQGEVYDSKFEAETFEKRKEMFEKQSVTKILPLIGFFLNLYIVLERHSLLFSLVEEGINLTQQNIESLENLGASKRLSLNYQIRKYKKLLKSIKST